MRLRICATWMFCAGCADPFVVPVDVSLGDANVAQTWPDGGTQSPGETDGESLADGGTYTRDGAVVVTPPADGGPGKSLFENRLCYRLPDPVLSQTVGQVFVDPASDFISVSSDETLGCMPPPADPALSENPNPGGPASDDMLRTSYQRVDGKPILRGGTRYSLLAPPDANPLDLKVLGAGVFAGDAPCEQRESLGSLVAFPGGGNGCVDLTPQADAKFMRLPIEVSWVIGSAVLQLCNVPCERPPDSVD